MTAISKQALFSTFYTQQRKDDESNSVQNLSSLTSKTKELWRGWKTPPPPPPGATFRD